MDFSSMSGWDFERYCADCLLKKGFTKAEVTSGSGDHGVDIIAEQNGIRFGIQCKLYQGQIPNKAVQEAYTGASYYDCDVAVIMSNSELTKQAQTEAKKLRVKFWNIADYMPKDDKDILENNSNAHNLPASYDEFVSEREEENREKERKNAGVMSGQKKSPNLSIRNPYKTWTFSMALKWLNLKGSNEFVLYNLFRAVDCYCLEVEEAKKCLSKEKLLVSKLSFLYYNFNDGLKYCEGGVDIIFFRDRIINALKDEAAGEEIDETDINLSYWILKYVFEQHLKISSYLQKVLDTFSAEEIAQVAKKSNNNWVDINSSSGILNQGMKESLQKLVDEWKYIVLRERWLAESPLYHENKQVREQVEQNEKMIEKALERLSFDYESYEIMLRKKQEETERMIQEEERRKKERLLKEKQEKELFVQSMISEYNDGFKKINLEISNRRKEFESKTRIAISQAQEQITDLLKKKQSFTFFGKERDAKIDASIATIEQHIEQLKKQLECDIVKCNAEAQAKIKALQEQTLDEAEKGGVKEELLKKIN